MSGGILCGGSVLARPWRLVEPESRNNGWMFRDYALFAHFSVAENIAFGLGGMARAGRLAGVQQIAGRIGVTHLLAGYAHAVSGGGQQRVALARALAPRPAMGLTDQPV